VLHQLSQPILLKLDKLTTVHAVDRQTLRPVAGRVRVDEPVLDSNA